jgi:branched-chain amino acid transport system permease protein
MSVDTSTAGPGGGRLSDTMREAASKYGLIAVLLAWPLYLAITDLADEGTLTDLGNNLVLGLSNGAIFALIALGYTLVYGIIELINFAHGDVFMIGSFVAFGLWGNFGLTESTGAGGLVAGLLVAMLVAMIVCGVLNVMIERVAYKPLRNAPRLAPLITAIGFSFILQNVGLLWRGGSPQGIANLIDSQQVFFSVAGVFVTHGDALAILVTVPLVLAMTTFISRSRLGKAMRATAQDPDAARLMGINVDTTISATFLIGGMLAGAAGALRDRGGPPSKRRSRRGA